jgi:hypothetical protein
MRLLRAHHIADLQTVVDNLLPELPPNPCGGRPVVLRRNEVITLLLFSSLAAPQHTMKGIYTWAQVHYYRRYKLPAYSSWVRKCHEALPLMLLLVDQLLDKEASVRLMDSTMLQVCRQVRADRHKVAREVAQFGKNHQGWHYGFKLHASCTVRGRLCALRFTPANEHDAQQISYLVNDATIIAVGDGGYTAHVMRRIIWERHHAVIVSPPHPSQKKQVMARWQKLLLEARVRIECVFDYLKQHLHLVSSFPRSIRGYFVHYVRIILSYQLMRGF